MIRIIGCNGTWMWHCVLILTHINSYNHYKSVVLIRKRSECKCGQSCSTHNLWMCVCAQCVSSAQVQSRPGLVSPTSACRVGVFGCSCRAPSSPPDPSRNPGIESSRCVTCQRPRAARCRVTGPGSALSLTSDPESFT